MGSLFIHRPVFASVISIVVVLLGTVALRALPVARYPQIAPPTISVTAAYPGADPETIASTVAAILEKEINGVEGMLYLSSVSSADGIASITVTFEVGTDLDAAQVLVQNRVAVAEPRLPEAVRTQGVIVKKRSSDIALLISLSSPEGQYDDLFLSNFAAMRLRDELNRIDGVGDIVIFGAGDYGMRVWLDTELLQARALTTTDVLNAMRRQNVQIGAGRIGAPPAPDGQLTEFGVSVRTRLSTAEEFGDIVIRADDQGRIVRLSDVARVELGAQAYTQRSRFNGSPAATLAIYQQPDANAIEVVESVRAKMQELAPAFPQGVHYDIVYEATSIIEASIREVVITLIAAVILVVLTVYVFLQSFRATLIPAATIPVSLIGTFAVMLALGFSINLLTLFGLVLAIGIVVDDAIVVVENVTRHLDESRYSPREAATRAMREVTGPVIATTLVLLAVFVPTAFLPGLQGQLFRQFALTIAIATIFSSINALTLSPALAGILLRPTPERPLLPFRLFNAALERVTDAYALSVRGLIKLAPIAILLFLAAMTLGVRLFASIPGGFVPQEDEGWCMVSIQLPDGASLQRTDEVMRRAEAAIAQTPGVEHVIAISGFSIIDGASVSSTGTIFTIFKDWDQRDDPDQSQAAILASINQALFPIQQARSFAFPLPSLPGMGASAGLAGMVEDRAGKGLGELDRALQDLLKAAGDQSDLRFMMSTFRTGTPNIFVDIDREAVESRGVNLNDLYQTLSAALGSMYINDFEHFGRTFQVRMQADARFRDEPADITELQVRNANGDMVPVGALASLRDSVAPSVVTRYNVYPAAKIMTAPAPGATAGQALDLTEQLTATVLPDGFGFEWTELAYQARQSGSPTAVFLLAVVLVFLVLAAQYESWTLPIAVIVAIPTTLLGAAAMLILMQLANSLYTQIGVVLLIGLSAKGSILIVEFARERHQAGDSPKQAAIAAAKLRFRAILMTAFSFILGVLPLLIASGAGAVSRRSIGATVFGGMLVGTCIAVIFVPVLFFAVQWTVDKVTRRAPTTRPARSAQ